MRLLRQPTNESCGQTVVAMIAGITIAEAFELFNHHSRTWRSEIQAKLRRRGFRVGELTRTRKDVPLPPLCVLKLTERGNKKWGHWAAYENGVIYDPFYGKNPKWPDKVRATSFMRIEKI